MSQGTIDFSGRNVFEQARLNRAIESLTRPAIGGESSAHQRRELIQQLWARKRQLLRHADATDDWGTRPPAA